METREWLLALKPARPRKLAVAFAHDAPTLQALAQAQAEGIAEPVLFGGREAIERAAKEAGLDLDRFEVEPAASDVAAARAAVEAVRAGTADMLMKGSLSTSVLLKAVLDKETGLRGNGMLSHVSILYPPALDRMLVLTDAGMVPYPDLQAKVTLVRNAVAAARCLGIERPRVAALAAVETVNPAMQATLDAAALAMMSARGQIQDCIVDGPLAMDLAISETAARLKGLRSEVAGRADVLLFHNIEAANSVTKTFTLAAGSLFGGVVMGAAAPIAVASRSDSQQNKLLSILCAARISEGVRAPA